jgi:hypothetical protein
VTSRTPALDEILADAPSGPVRSRAEGPAGRLPIDAEMLRDGPSGDLFGLTQNAGMGWDPGETTRTPYLILRTLGGVRGEDGRPIARG